MPGDDTVRGVAPGEAFRASFAQERLWFFTQLVPEFGVYNQGCPFELYEYDERPDPDCFEGAFADVVQRHESLRTELAEIDGELMQVVRSSVPIRIEHTDLRHLPPEEIDAEVERICRADAARRFPLDRAPLWRARMIRRGEHDWRFMLVVHHAIADARSAARLGVELYHCYQARRDGHPVRLPEPGLQYVDFAVWQRARLAAGEFDEQLEYWSRTLAEPPEPLRLPVLGDPPAAGRRNAGAAAGCALPQETHAAVAAMARSAGTTQFVVLLAAFATLLHRLCGQEDLLIGTPVAGRETPELDHVVGMFVNTLLIRVDCSGRPGFRELLARVRGRVLDALDHQQLPYDRLAAMLAKARVADGSPLQQAELNLLPTSDNRQIRNGTTKVDLALDLADVGGRYDGTLEFRRDLFDDACAAGLGERLRRLLDAALADPDRPIGLLPLLDEPEHAAAVTAADARPASLALPPTPNTTPTPVTDLFAAHAAARPASLAVTDSSGCELTYAQLDERSARLARYLRDRLGGEPDTIVGLLLETRVELAVAVLGVLRAGAAYLPLDPGHPAEHRARLLKDAGAAAVLVHGPDARSVAQFGCGVPVIDLAEDLPEAAPTPAAPAHRDALACVVYTSGSTGEPKAVGVTHGNLAAYADQIRPLLDAAPGHSFAQLQPLTFDFAATVFYGALTSGGTLHLASRELAADAAGLAGLIERAAVDYLKITPSHLRALQAGSGTNALLPRRMLILGGEACDPAYFAQLRTGRPGCAVVNHYGPTEATVGALALAAGSTAHHGAHLAAPLGWPMARSRAHILDEELQPVPDGVAGEICLAGDGLARGYVGKPGATAQRFVPDPYAAHPGGRLYRTGDRGRRLPDGAIEFLGRTEDRVKIHGFQVEPGEVQRAFTQHPAVADCVVLTDHSPGAEAEHRLTAYLVAAPGASLDAQTLQEVRTHVARLLPEYMVPTTLVPLEQFPRCAHGKVDRAKLPLSAADTHADPRPADRFLSPHDLTRIAGWNATDADLGGEDLLSWLGSGEVSSRVCRLARRLRESGVGVGDVVGVRISRGWDQVVAVHAVVCAGAAYLPLDPEYPEQRLSWMVANTGARLVITPGVLAQLEGEAQNLPDTALNVSVPSSAPVYVIYTSGSTGTPKGVVVSHAALSNRLRWMQEAFGLGTDDRVLLKTPFGFDVSVWELFWPLAVGAGLVVAEPGRQGDPEYLSSLIEREGVTTVHFVPSMLDALLDSPDVGVRCAGLRRVVTSGEVLSAALAARFHEALPGVELHNLYGPTEAAIDVTWQPVPPGAGTVTIGRPIANTRVEILDVHGLRTPVGVPGELCIGGVQVANGYAGRAAQTAEKFVPDAYGEVPGARLYRTGDLARWLPSGEIDYLGRIDRQVKIRGHRIEPGEIEAAFTEQPEIRACAVDVRTDSAGARLVAYLVPAPGVVLDQAARAELRTRLLQRLPEYLVPAAVVAIDALPVTANGKLDRSRLPDPATAPHGGSEPDLQPPATELETLIAQIWSQVLGLPQVAADDNFFAIGGDSIRSLKVIARMRAAGRSLTFQQIFEHPTVRGLARQLDAQAPADRAERTRATAFGMVDPADLALLQQRGSPRPAPAPTPARAKEGS